MNVPRLAVWRETLIPLEVWVLILKYRYWQETRDKMKFVSIQLLHTLPYCPSCKGVAFWWRREGNHPFCPKKFVFNEFWHSKPWSFHDKVVRLCSKGDLSDIEEGWTLDLDFENNKQEENEDEEAYYDRLYFTDRFTWKRTEKGLEVKAACEAPPLLKRWSRQTHTCLLPSLEELRGQYFVNADPTNCEINDRYEFSI